MIERRSSPASQAHLSPCVAVVIPCYRVAQHIVGVINRIPELIDLIYVVDDCCPEASGELVEKSCTDGRVKVVYRRKNGGVGAAMVSGYRAALEDGADIIVKIDGDGQMPPELIPLFVGAIASGQADYAKGNRFFNFASLSGMPSLRLLGNAVLYFISKATSGYWDVMDPTNGFTAIDSEALRLLPLDKVEPRYFFENDMLFRLGTLRAVVRDIPMDAVYADEESSMRIGRVLVEFPGKFLNRILKRIVYNYFLRDFNAASVQLLSGLMLLAVSAGYGVHWIFEYAARGEAAPFGMVMVPAIAAILGFQLLLAAVSIDISSVPREPISTVIRRRRMLLRGEEGAEDHARETQSKIVNL